MATTIVEFEKRDDEHSGQAFEVSEEVVEYVKEEYRSVQRDDDKCGTSDDCIYYCGRIDALQGILWGFGWKVKE